MKYLTLTLLVLSFVTISCSNETQLEKAEVEVNSAQRNMVKGINRINEAACGTLNGDNKVKCLAKKVKNRAVESKDVIIDEASKIKNKLDN